jgi:stearoyl-CoA desaturase (delta-9 desaturase)
MTFYYCSRLLQIIAFLLSLYVFDWQYFLIAVIVGWLLAGFSISVILHRKVSHNAFNFKNKIVERFSYAMLIITGQSSPLSWAIIHRQHHSHTDTALDPQSHRIVGPWRTLFSWYTPNKVNPRQIVDLLANHNVMFLHHHIDKLFLIYAAILLTVSPTLFLYAIGVIPVIAYLFIGIINTVGHSDDQCLQGSYAANLPFPVLFWGESYHKAHHLAPSSQRMGQYDFGFYIMQLLKKHHE